MRVAVVAARILPEPAELVAQALVGLEAQSIRLDLMLQPQIMVAAAAVLEEAPLRLVEMGRLVSSSLHTLQPICHCHQLAVG
jgi:hypothetical protein